LTSGRARAFAGLAGAAALGAGLLLSPPVAAETLDEALARAYQSSPSLLAARARLRATDETIAQALSGWRPTVELSYDAGKTRVDSRSSTSTQIRTPRVGELSVKQNLYRGGRTVSDTRRAEFGIQAERARLVATEQGVMFDAASAYMDVVRDEAVLRLNQNNERVLQRQLEATRDRFNVGEVTRTDVAQAESRLAGARSQRIGSQGDLERSRAAYLRAMGVAPSALRPAKPLGGLPESEAAALSVAREKNPTVVAARFDERASAAAVRSVKADLYPKLDLQGTVRRADETSSVGSRTDSEEISAQLTVPLYQAGGVSSRIREAKQVNSQRLRDLEQAVRATVENATRAWQALVTAGSRIRAFDAQVRAAEIALDGVRQEAQVGSRTVLDVLNAEQELLDGRVSLVRAQRDEVVASFDLRRATGNLTARDLGLPVEIYDFDKYYKSIRGRWYGWDIGKE